jgi:hypothetical protein
MTEMNGLHKPEQNIEMLKEDDSLLLKWDSYGTNAVNRELVLTVEPYCCCFLLTTVCSITRKGAASYLVLYHITICGKLIINLILQSTQNYYYHWLEIH